MTQWKAKRFWKSAQPVELGHGFSIHLDGRQLRTPAGTPMVVPTETMARAIAEEWNVQGREFDPTRMPVTRAANSAIDNVSGRTPQIVEMLAAYADTDLICYRAAAPPDLVARQISEWDPLLGWVHRRFGVRLVPVEGVIHHPQPLRTLETLRMPLEVMTPFELAAMHDLVSISGSLVIGLAVSDGHDSTENMWKCSIVDEGWQTEQWGEDTEAQQDASQKRSAFLEAGRFLALARS